MKSGEAPKIEELPEAGRRNVAQPGLALPQVLALPQALALPQVDETAAAVPQPVPPSAATNSTWR
jgi:hypothetical protein